jgi:hypothetical protein
MRIAKTMTRLATAPVTTKAIQYVSRSNLRGLPFHAEYPITAAIDGAATKKVSKINTSSSQKPALESIVGEE